MPDSRSNAVDKLKSLLVENGREHLLVRDEQGTLVVHTLSDDGKEEKHFRLQPKAKAKGYEVAFWDHDDWKKVPISGTLEKVVDQLVSSTASRTVPPPAEQ